MLHFSCKGNICCQHISLSMREQTPCRPGSDDTYTCAESQASSWSAFGQLLVIPGFSLDENRWWHLLAFPLLWEAESLQDPTCLWKNTGRTWNPPWRRGHLWGSQWSPSCQRPPQETVPPNPALNVPKQTPSFPPTLETSPSVSQ